MRGLFFSVSLLFSPLSLVSLTLDQTIHSESVVLMNAKSGRLLWQKKPDLAVYPASTTKIATVFYTLLQKPNSLKERVIVQKEALVCVSPFEKRRDNYAKCPAYWLESDGSHVGIKVGEEMSLGDLLYATMLSSGNDASNVLAQTVGGGSIDRFITELNQFLQKIGCTSTYFKSPHGLHHPDHKTTAKDMARLAQCAMYHPLFRKIAKTQSYERPATNKQPKALYVQTNRLLRQGNYYYPYAVGIKTGYHSKAQHALVAAAEKEGRLLICSLFQCKDRSRIWQDAKALFEAAFNEQKIEKELVTAGDQTFSLVLDEAQGPIKTYTKEPLKAGYYPSEEPELRCLLVWDEKITLPVLPGTHVGSLQLLADNEPIATHPLYAKEHVKEKLFCKLINQVKAHWLLISALVLFLALVVTGLYWRRR